MDVAVAQQPGIADGLHEPPTQGALFREVMLARQRVYRLAEPTPIHQVRHPGGATFMLKREDLSPIHSYKWRGAMNRLSALAESGDPRPIVACSAGNHGQGVASAARALGLSGTVFMPRSTPSLKVREVRRLGAEQVRVELIGDTVDEAAAAAAEHSRSTGAVIIPPYDDPHVIAGQGTIGDEIVTANVRPSRVYLQIGGGGMAAGVACVLKTYYPEVRIIGVEGDGQASMLAAVQAGKPVALDTLDRFCDGTAVRTAGRITHRLCSDLIDEFITVTNNEVCAAMQFLWESCRVVPEPSGAMGVAAVLREQDPGAISGSLAVLSGANMDFATLAWISRHAGIGLMRRQYFEFAIPEHRGTLVALLEQVGDAVNIVDFQYGKVDQHRAFPVLGFEGTAESLRDMQHRLRALPVEFQDVTSREIVDFRVIPLRPELFKRPFFAIIDFPERAGALRDFMRTVSDIANICYFNYQTTGETEGHAMMGFEFATDQARAGFLDRLRTASLPFRPVSTDLLEPSLELD